MPGAGVQIVGERVGGSVVTKGGRASTLVAVQLLSVGVLRGVGALCCSGPVKWGCARTAR